eukprot:tig00020952_g16505.t1
MNWESGSRSAPHNPTEASNPDELPAEEASPARVARVVAEGGAEPALRLIGGSSAVESPEIEVSVPATVDAHARRRPAEATRMRFQVRSHENITIKTVKADAVVEGSPLEKWGRSLVAGP